MKILINGAGGQLGGELLSYFNRIQKTPNYNQPANHQQTKNHHHTRPTSEQVLGLNRILWDITHTKQSRYILEKEQPDVLLHCAAFTHVDRCEDEPDLAHEINAKATGMIAGLCRELGIRMVYISTDYVFDGQKETGYTEADPTSPINQYGQSKREGEEWVARLCPDHLILRTSWLYGTRGQNFPKTILSKAKRGESLSIVTDQVGSPTYTGDLAHQIYSLLQSEAKGIYHTANQGSCSWYQFAEQILHVAGLSYQLNPITSSELDRKAKRPTWSILQPHRLLEENRLTLPTWESGLRSFFRDGGGEVL